MTRVLVCFAVKEEAAFFRAQSNPGGCAQIITGMGRKNAEAGLRRALAAERPSMVITAGFAGGLNPKLTVGTVVFDADLDVGCTAGLLAAGAVKGQFHCVDRVAVTIEEKRALWESTGADAVEMESSAMRAICQESGIPSATVRVISDAANENLPLDFNTLMDSNARINYLKLAVTIASSPSKIPQLMRFQKQTQAAAQGLAKVLESALRA